LTKRGTLGVFLGPRRCAVFAAQAVLLAHCLNLLSREVEGLTCEHVGAPGRLDLLGALSSRRQEAFSAELESVALATDQPSSAKTASTRRPLRQRASITGTARAEPKANATMAMHTGEKNEPSLSAAWLTLRIAATPTRPSPPSTATAAKEALGVDKLE